MKNDKAKKRFFVTVILAGIFLSLTACGSKEAAESEECQHQYGKWTVVRDAGCTDEGVQSRVCTECGYTDSQTSPALGHSYDAGKVTENATCEGTGIRTYICTTCGHQKTEDIAKLGHDAGDDLICTRCGEKVPLTLEMTAAEKTAAGEVQYISQRQIWHDDTENYFVLVYSLLDTNQAEELTAPAVVEIVIENDKGAVVYSSTKIVKASDYQNWYYNNGSTRKLQGTIYIHDDEIVAGAVDSGKIKFKVYNEGYFSFDESTLSIYNELPIKDTTVIFKNLPGEVNELSYDGRVLKGYNITEVTYEVSSPDRMTIYLSGVKTQDADGAKNRDRVDLDWKLYDAEGYIVDSGSIFGSQIAVGEKFRKEEIYISGDIEIGETYYLEVMAGEVSPDDLVTIKLPSLPDTIIDYGYDNKLDSACNVSNVTYTIDRHGTVSLYFSGEKVSDRRGDSYSQSCKIGWKLYDSAGAVVASRVFYSPNIKIGEKFENEKEYVFIDITPGETYTLEILNVD